MQFFVMYIVSIVSSVSARKLKRLSSAWLGSETSQLGLARAGKFQLELISTIQTFRVCSFWYYLIYLSDSDPEEIEVQKLAKTVSEVVGISDTVQFKAGKVRQGTIHILRKHLYCTKLNLTTNFFYKTFVSLSKQKNIFSALHFNEIFML